MQFSAAAIFAVLASVAAAQQVTVTVYECETSAAPVVPVPTAPTYVSQLPPSPTAPAGTAVGSTGVSTGPQPTGSPIYEGAASINGASALGMIIAGGVALLI
ncbi:hypothetical protein V499_03107 [Pseudogymnoascus sp. VKM F-103]|uniref:Uncharacterized protein n=1 Tax=Pseudogymnoascus verrucosus TaxID=342668 RepID=A0A1B8GBZ4_9PEZI|nr:uncharacterized protein VE01_08756 [Pseudogymnoascus verrucosus]KFY77548.1 hypothetical protein V499_03107 [Pseudogymnoascus sp. VKM F-103]OBT52668.1 hypothetical protein VE04_07550 [Pseudogymnoascus sp. 24MN13]OBT93369.1 hypothetical protein VE01_08756 [Pseudogymnoascus verrucosus]